MEQQQEVGSVLGGVGKEVGKETACRLCRRLHTIRTAADIASTYISAPSRMFDVILGTTSGLNLAKIDLLV